MWVTPKPTLGGAGMWDQVRINDVVVLQRYTMEGTVFAGLFNGLRSLYSDAPSYRLIAVHSPYWEYANGHNKEGMETLMDWLELNVLAKLFQYDVGGFAKGDTDVRIRVLTDFMKIFVPMFGQLHKQPLNESDFRTVLNLMNETHNALNTSHQVIVTPKAASVHQSAAMPQQGATSSAHASHIPPTMVAQAPLYASQLVTRYEKDPATGMIRSVHVYQPVQAPTFSGYPGTIYIPPAPANNFHAPMNSGHSVQFQHVSQSHAASSGTHSQSASLPRSNVLPPPNGYPPSANMIHNGNAYAPARSSAQPSHYHPPNPYSPQNPPAPPNPSGSSNLPVPNTNQSNSNPHLPVSDWDAAKAQKTKEDPPASSEKASPPTTNPATTPASSSSSASTKSRLDDDSAAPSVAPSAPAAEDDDKNLCKLCFERDLDCALLPCSHVTCYECATSMKLTKCPFCRTDISQVLKLYRA